MEKTTGIIELWCESGIHYVKHEVSLVTKEIVDKQEQVVYMKTCSQCNAQKNVTVVGEIWDDIMAEC